MLESFQSWFHQRFVQPSVQRALSDANSNFKSQLVKYDETLKLIREDVTRGLHDLAAPPPMRESSLGRDLREAIALQGSGIPMAAPGEASVKERDMEWELALDSRGWQREFAVSAMEFSRFGIEQITLISRLYFLKNPLVKRGVKICGYYVLGRGIEIRSENETANAVLQQFLSDNETELGHSGLVEKVETLHTDGNVFFVLFTSPATGRAKVRTIDSCEMVEVITNPEDVSEPWYYHRRWNQRDFDRATGLPKMTMRELWYPALDFEPGPGDRPSFPVAWDQPVLHAKRGGLPKWQFGLPDVWSAIDWARSYREALEAWLTVRKTLARFAWIAQTKGGQQGIDSLQGIFATQFADGPTATNGIDRNPPVNVASAFITDLGNTLTPVNAANKQDSPEDCRRVLLMVCASFGLPETFFGDASTGSLATATSLDRPTELKFLEEQEFWRYIISRLCNSALQASARAPKGILKESVESNKAEIVTLVRRLKPTGQAFWEAPPKKAGVEQISVKVRFPAVLEHDIGAMVTAITNATTFGGFTPAGGIDRRVAAGLLMTQVGVEDVDVVLDVMYPLDSYDPEVKDDPAPDPAASDATVPAGGKPAKPKMSKEALTLAATQTLIKASKKLLEAMKEEK